MWICLLNRWFISQLEDDWSYFFRVSAFYNPASLFLRFIILLKWNSFYCPLYYRNNNNCISSWIIKCWNKGEKESMWNKLHKDETPTDELLLRKTNSGNALFVRLIFSCIEISMNSIATAEADFILLRVSFFFFFSLFTWLEKHDWFPFEMNNEGRCANAASQGMSPRRPDKDTCC